DAQRCRPAVRPRIVRDGRERAPASRRRAASHGTMEAIFPRRRVDRQPGAAHDGHPFETTGYPRRLERRLGVDLEVGDARVRMIGLLEAVDERAALDRYAAARRLDPRMRFDEPRLHREIELDDVAALPGSIDSQIALGSRRRRLSVDARALR